VRNQLVQNAIYGLGLDRQSRETLNIRVREAGSPDEHQHG
jgi:hypothetical protein